MSDARETEYVPTDVYPVGLLMDWQRRKVRPLRRAARYPWSAIRERNWRRLRNYLNGYLAEHEGCAHNAGRGWTKRTARRRVECICQAHIADALNAPYPPVQSPNGGPA